ncbi:MAG: hypothetical protein ABI723_00685 [Bacteroidia bacterium]
MLAASALKKEFRLGKIITITNIVIGIISCLPALLCFILMLDALFLNGEAGSDTWGEISSSWQDTLFLSFASLLLIAFYRSIFLNPFLFGFKKQIKSERLKYWMTVILINLLTIIFFLIVFGKYFIPSSFYIKDAFLFLFRLFIYSPIIQLLIAAIGYYYNTLQKPDNSIPNEN